MAEENKQGFWAQLGRTYGAPPWSIAEAGLALIILLVNMIWIAVVVAVMLSPDVNNPSQTALVLGWIIGLSLTTLMTVTRWRRSQERFAALRLSGELAQTRRPLPLILMIGVAIGLTANLLAAIGAELIGRIDNNFVPVAALQGFYPGLTHMDMLLGALFVILIQPISEGIIFYGIVAPRLRISFGAWPGLLLTALLYAGYHFIVFGARSIVIAPFWYGFFAPLIVGFALAAIRVWQRSTRAAIIAAIGIGITSAVISFLFG